MGHTAADVNYKDVWTSLIARCHSDHLDVVKYLVEACHRDVNFSDSFLDDTSLTRACHNICMSVSMYLLYEVSDPDVNIADRDGNTAVHFAV